MKAWRRVGFLSSDLDPQSILLLILHTVIHADPINRQNIFKNNWLIDYNRLFFRHVATKCILLLDENVLEVSENLLIFNVVQGPLFKPSSVRIPK